MRATKQEQTGAQGLSEVRANFEALGWGPAENPNHDHGTDLYIQPRDERLFDLPCFLGAQVKSGPSYFGEPLHENGALVGWWYREQDGDHFDYWIRHALPHLLVLHDLDLHVSYWVHVTADAVQSTGKGNKILVPAQQRVEPGQLDALLAVAQKSKFPLEGSAWTVIPRHVSPNQRYRFALLAPRLVAPHPNAGYEGAITPEQAIALLVQGRLMDLGRFAERHAAVPHPSREAPRSSEWGWRFVAALWSWLAGGEIQVFGELVDAAPDSSRRVAAAIVWACALLDREDHEQALETLDAVIARDDAEPVDWYWLHAQRGRLRLELGDPDKARADGLTAVSAVGTHGDDVTARAIAAAGAWLIWQTLDWSERRVDELITSSDTAISWWRAQTISWALAEASERSFSAWADERAIRFAAEDVLQNKLFAATLGAHLSGEHSSWRSSLSLLARHKLMGRHQRGDVDGIAEALYDLRRSGDHAALSKAARRVWRIGPLSPLLRAVEGIQAKQWTHTTAHANFKLWETAGDLLEPEPAAYAARFCLSVLEREFPDELVRARPGFLVDIAALESLPSLLFAADEEVHREALSLLARLPADLDELVATSFVSVLRAAHISSLARPDRESLLAFALAVQRADLAGAILGWLSQRGDSEAQQSVLQRARGGDLYALRELEDLTGLQQSEAARIVALAEERVDKIVANARNNSWGMGGFDYVALLAVFNSHFPAVAAWDRLLEALAEPQVAINDKEGACRALTANVDRIPPDIKERLAAMLDQIAATQPRFLPGEEGSILGLVEHLTLALGVLEPEDYERRLAGLALLGWEERRDLAYALSGKEPSGLAGMLAALAGDEHADVRAAAAWAAARRITSAVGGNVEREVVSRLARSEGASAPLAVLAGFAGHGEHLDALTRSLIAELSTHLSGRVRRRANEITG